MARTWHVDHGLPQNTVQAFCHARDGFLWFGTRFGLARFDGHAFQTFQPTEIPAFQDGSITALAEDDRGVLWIATQDRLIRHQFGKFERVEAVDGERFWALWSESPDRLWLGLQQGLAVLEGSRLIRIPMPDNPGIASGLIAEGRGVRSLAPDGPNTLIVTTQDAWYRLDLASRQIQPWTPRLKVNPEFPPGNPSGTSPALDWRAHPIVLRAESDLRERIFSGSNTSLRQWGPRTVSDGNGGWWCVSADRRLYRISEAGDAFEILGPPTQEETCLAVLSDREGSHWIGTAAAGAIHLRPRLFDPIQIGHGRDAPCFTVALDSLGNPWTANRSLLVKVQGLSPESWNIALPGFSRQIHSLAPSADGGWWIGWERNGLYHWHPDSNGSSPKLVAFEGERPRALYVARDGALWIGLSTGVARHHQGMTERYTTADGLPHPDVRAVHEDRSGQFWVATFGGGIARRVGDRFVSHKTQNGLSSDTVWGFLEDKRRALWIYGLRGLTRFHSNTWSTVTREHGLFDDLTNQMIEDDSGHVWFGCNRGIYKVRLDELHAVADRRLESLRCIVFGAADGLPVAETNGENQPAVARGPDGVLWFPTPVGLLRVDSHRAPVDEIPPRVHITHVRTESRVLRDEWGLPTGLDQDSKGDLEIPPGMARVVEAEFTAPHFIAPERIRFRHRLLGYEEAWSTADSRRTTRYTNLRPGRYRLEVIACNSHGVWATQPATFPFRVAPHFYQNPPIIAGGLALLTLALFAAHRVRLRSATHRQALETELRLARERERIARDMHDDVGASLTQIAFLSARAETLPSPSNPALPSLIRRIAGTTREAAQSMDEIVWALNPRNDRLDHLAGYLCQFSRDYLEPTGIRCRLDIPSVLPPHPISSEVRHHILMVLKESLNNTVKHSGATEFRIALQVHSDHIVLTLADNGRGFERPAHRDPSPLPQSAGAGISAASPLTPDESARDESGLMSAKRNGLDHVARRVALLGGTFELTTKPGAGTQWVTRWPLRITPRSWD